MAKGVTEPEVGCMVATVVLVLLQLPPPVLLVRVVGEPMQALVAPPMAGGVEGAVFTVTVTTLEVVLHPPCDTTTV